MKFEQFPGPVQVIHLKPTKGSESTPGGIVEFETTLEEY